MTKVDREITTIRLPIEVKRRVEQYAKENSFSFSTSLIALLNRGFEQMDTMQTLNKMLNVLNNYTDTKKIDN